MIKAIFFDYGGVLADDRKGEHLYERLAANIGVDLKTAQEILQPLWHEFSRGRMTEAEVWAHVEHESGMHIPVTMRNIWNSWSTMPRFQKMLDFAAELKKEGYIVGILSTTVASTEAEVRAHGGYELFDPVILSCEVGYAKPDPEIYRIAMDRIPGIRPDETIFLDDRPMCLPPAQALGMHTVLVKDSDQAIAATRELLRT